MNLLNETFLEEYKYLDKLCREMYNSDKGVTVYIDDMSNVQPFESRYIPNWHFDLKRLKELRHIRNQLSHEVGTLNMQMCTQEDINWLRNFHSRILNTSDPLSLLTKSRTKKPVEKPKYNTYTSNTLPTEKSSGGCLTSLLFILGGILSIVLTVIFCIS